MGSSWPASLAALAGCLLLLALAVLGDKPSNNIAASCCQSFRKVTEPSICRVIKYDRVTTCGNRKPALLFHTNHTKFCVDPSNSLVKKIQNFIDDKRKCIRRAKMPSAGARVGSPPVGGSTSTEKNHVTKETVTKIAHSIAPSTTDLPNMDGRSIDLSTTDLPNMVGRYIDPTTDLPNMVGRSIDPITDFPNIAGHSTQDPRATALPSVEGRSTTALPKMAAHSTDAPPSVDREKKESPGLTQKPGGGGTLAPHRQGPLVDGSPAIDPALVNALAATAAVICGAIVAILVYSKLRRRGHRGAVKADENEFPMESHPLV